jgi:hypothetical protein
MRDATHAPFAQGLGANAQFLSRVLDEFPLLHTQSIGQIVRYCKREFSTISNGRGLASARRARPGSARQAEIIGQIVHFPLDGQDKLSDYLPIRSPPGEDEMARHQKPAAVAAEDFEPDAFVIRTCAADGTSCGNFRWPLDVGAVVVCPDWQPTAKCGHGLHGLLDGIGDWSLIDGATDRVWQIIGVLRAETVRIDDGKVKFPRAKIAYSGSAPGAFGFIQKHTVAAIQSLAKGNTATGDRGHAAATGYGGHAAATGYYGHAAATGKNSIAASVGFEGTAQGALDTWIVLAAYDDNYDLVCVKTAKIGGPEGLKADTPYRLTSAGEFVEAA